MLKSTKGIVLHSLKYGESGKIVHIYTEHDGLLSFIVQGFGSKSTLKKIHFQSLNILSISYYFTQKSNLLRIKEAKIICGDSRESNVNKLSMQLFLSELLYKSIKEEEKNPELFEFLKSWLEEFQSQNTPPINTHLIFTLNLTKYLGFYPNYTQAGKYFNLKEGVFENTSQSKDALTKEKSDLFYRFTTEKSVYSNSERKILLGILLEYYKYHIENFNELKSKPILELVLS